MNKFTFVLIVLFFSIGLIYAQSTSSSIIINYTVPEVVSISINELSRDINLNFGGVGSSIYEARQVDATYNISVNSSRAKQLMASLNQNMPPNMNLDLRATAPTHGTSAGFVALSTSPRTLVSNINNVNQNNLLLNFRLRADLGAQATTSPQMRIVTLTISD